jgi:hypothetical protein
VFSTFPTSNLVARQLQLEYTAKVACIHSCLVVRQPFNASRNTTWRPHSGNKRNCVTLNYFSTIYKNPDENRALPPAAT